MAWFPMGAEGRRRLATERRALRLLAERCSFRVPRVLHEDPGAGWDVRALVAGACDPWGLYERVRADRGLARWLGRAIGAVLAEQHARVRREDVAGWLPETLSWPEPLAVVRRDLPAVVDDPSLLAAIERALRRYEEQEAAVAAGDRVLVHGDLGFHNVAVDPATDELLGVFDYDGAAWADRHHDFRYLVFGDDDESVLDGALGVYEPATGTRIDRSRVRLCNAAGAIGFLAYRRGVPPETRSCGRTLEEDLRWTRAALSAIGLGAASP
jgi:aminoglycoside phosphotransferase (APT) family kinase protein